MTRSFRSILLGSLAVMLVAAAPLEAQQPDRRGGGGRQDREQLEQRIRARMGEMMRRELGLSEVESAQLAEIIEDFEGQRRELFREERATRREVESLLQSGSDDPAAAAELVERRTTLRMREAELFGNEQEALLQMLTPTQLLRMQELRERIGRRIRELRGGRSGDSRRRGGGGAGDQARGLRWGPDVGPGQGWGAPRGIAGAAIG